jgi:hypothetical protein
LEARHSPSLCEEAALSAAAVLFEAVWADAVHVNNAVASKAGGKILGHMSSVSE